jgi:hypothetical protein
MSLEWCRIAGGYRGLSLAVAVPIVPRGSTCYNDERYIKFMVWLCRVQGLDRRFSSTPDYYAAIAHELPFQIQVCAPGAPAPPNLTRVPCRPPDTMYPAVDGRPADPPCWVQSPVQAQMPPEASTSAAVFADLM